MPRAIRRCLPRIRREPRLGRKLLLLRYVQPRIEIEIPCAIFGPDDRDLIVKVASDRRTPDVPSRRRNVERLQDGSHRVNMRQLDLIAAALRFERVEILGSARQGLGEFRTTGRMLDISHPEPPFSVGDGGREILLLRSIGDGLRARHALGDRLSVQIRLSARRSRDRRV